MNISNYLDAIAKPFQGLAPWILRLVLRHFIYPSWLWQISFATRKNGQNV